MKIFKSLKISSKIAFLAMASVFLTAIFLLIIVGWQNDLYSRLTQQEVDKLINLNLQNISRGVYSLVETEHTAIQQQVNSNLDVMQHLVDNSGGISLSEDKVLWPAVNQFTQEKIQVNLPKMMLNNIWIGMNDNFNDPCYLVDLVTQLTDATATVFQRMNKKGDMLRISTTVRKGSGKRAIKTYIPAIKSDGSFNPVISTILAGKEYQGVAFVVNKKYITAYRPIKDESGYIIGMIYVGVAKNSVENRIRDAILKTKVGESGYVYVISGKGNDKGRYIISKDGARDGENIWQEKDASGNFIIQEVVNQALTLKPGEFYFKDYCWRNKGELKPHWKKAIVTYYAPWDWVIGTNIYEKELDKYKLVLRKGQKSTRRKMFVFAIIITLIAGIITVFITFNIIRPIQIITNAAKKVTEGNYDQNIKISYQDEIGILANTFNYMTKKLKETIEALKRSESKFREIFDNAPEGIFRSSLENRFEDVNPALAKMFSYNSPEEMIKSVKSIPKQIYLNSEERDLLMALVKQTNKVEGFEIQAKRKDGSIFWMSVNMRTVLDDNNEILCYEGTIENITKRKKAEEALKKSETTFRTLTENAQDVIMRFDHHFRHLYVNPAIFKQTGMMPIDFIGKTHEEMGFPKDLCEKWHEILEKTFISKKINRLEFKLPNNTWIDWIVMPEFDEIGNVNAVMTSARDITDFMNVEAAVRESDEKFRQIADNVNEGFAVVDIETNKILYMNKVLKEIWGITENEDTIIADVFLEKIHPDDRATIGSYDKIKKESFSVEHRIIREGKIRWLRSRGFPVKDSSGKIFRCVHIVSDITQYKEASEKSKLQQLQLLQADKMVSLGVLVSGVAHEVNNPNNFIMLNTPLVVEAWKSALPVLDKYYKDTGEFILAGMDYSEMKENIIPLLDGISSGAKRIQRIVKSLKDYSRQDEYDIYDKVDLHDIINSAITLLGSMIKKSTNKFALSLCEEKMIVQGNFQRLEQVVINLIQNACDSLKSQSKKITITTKIITDKNMAQIIIQDEGIGIEPEHLQKIMDPFFTTKRTTGGTGLGLSVSLGIVKDHQGELRFESTKGKGTKAIVTLPIIRK